jgi:hypothetical protein
VHQVPGQTEQLAGRVAPLTGAFVIGFIIWTHVTAGKAFWLNRIELLAILAVIAAVWLVWDHQAFALAATAVTIASCIISIFADLYPNVMVSATNPAYLTVHNTASGADSLKVMTVVVIILLAVVLAYQTGPTTCSGAASAGRHSSRPRRLPQPRPNRNPHRSPLLPRRAPGAERGSGSPSAGDADWARA